ncbi:MAG: divalent-cation tolerance protein CutA [Bacteroidia bacterium]
MLIIYITCASFEEAKNIGRELVEKRLVACVNLLPNMTSFYHWEGKIVEDSEVVLIAKTTSDKFEEIVSLVKSLHSYEVPCIVAYPIEKGEENYLAWIKNEVTQNSC